MLNRRRIFQPSSSNPWRLNAQIGGYFAEAGSYEFTFAEAAKHLGDEAVRSGLLDFYFLPMCFLFRHASELTLKSLTLEAERFLMVLNELGETAVPTDYKALERDLRRDDKTHSLHWLLNRLETRMAHVPACEPIPEKVRSAIMELHNLDPRGITFRYSIDDDGRRTLAKPGLVDVQRVRDELSEAHELLFYGLGSWLSENRETAADFLSDLRAEARNV